VKNQEDAWPEKRKVRQKGEIKKGEWDKKKGGDIMVRGVRERATQDERGGAVEGGEAKKKAEHRLKRATAEKGDKKQKRSEEVAAAINKTSRLKKEATVIFRGRGETTCVTRGKLDCPSKKGERR